MNWRRRLFSCFFVGIFTAFMAAPAFPSDQEEKEARPKISGNPAKPRRHFRVREAAELSKEESESIYNGLKDALVSGYLAAGDPLAEEYSSWDRYNDAPYRSATHGQRYVNNYGNSAAKAYGKYEHAGTLPVGSIIAKDSFSVTRAGEVRPGPLFVVEKMEPGFNYVSGDWRYIMIMPDGELFGMTKGVRAERVEFCIGCHLVQEQQDYLFFVPEDYRVD